MSGNNRNEEVVTTLVNCLKGFMVIAVKPTKQLLGFVVSLLIEGKWTGLVVSGIEFDEFQSCVLKTLEIKLKPPGSNEHSPCADRFLQQLNVLEDGPTLWIQKYDGGNFALPQYDIAYYCRLMLPKSNKD